jgi:hypothetical protein
MNSRINEDLAWLRVQDKQREAENRRLMAGAPSSRAASAIRRVIASAIASARSRRATPPPARAAIKTQHHA